MLKKTLAVVGLSVVALYADAAIQDFGVVTRDSNTGLDWLDVTETRGLSYSQVSAQMEVGGAYDGWRYATLAELDQLIINFGYTAVNADCGYTSLHCDSGLDELQVIEVIIRTLGDTQDAYYDETNHPFDVPETGAGRTIGILGTSHRTEGEYDVAFIEDFEARYRSEIDGELRENKFDRVNTARLSVGAEGSNREFGSFLVAPSEVPIPAAAWFFGSALLGLAGIKCKR